MKKVGDLLTALGSVGFIAVVLELVIDWKMIPQSIILWFIIGSLILLIVGIIMRNSGVEKSNGADMKQIGIAMIIFGASLFVITLCGMFSSNTQSVLYNFVNERFFFIVVFGFLFLLLGIIFRSIGKSKETKAEKRLMSFINVIGGIAQSNYKNFVRFSTNNIYSIYLHNTRQL